jgi:hypothetical protein
MQISGAVREINALPFTKSPRCGTPNASSQYRDLRQEYQPGNIVHFMSNVMMSGGSGRHQAWVLGRRAGS